MTWIDTIDDLDYYVTPYGAPCYCDQLLYPSDLALQIQITNSQPSAGLDLDIYVMSADGLTTYENATSYFQFYYFTIGGIQYVNMRLKTYSPAMCSYKCWILYVTLKTKLSPVQTLFAKYTQRYCQTTCCDIPRGATFTPAEVTDFASTLSEYPLAIPTTECGTQVIRIQTHFDCLDYQLGEYYGIPAGQTWGFTKITNIAGKILQKVREITRNISYNCNLQRAESAIPYKLYTPFKEGTFPAWKLNELEAMFHARVINVTDFINNYSLQFDGGVIAKNIGENVCWNLFQLDVMLRSCFIRQTFGCDTGCDTGVTSMTFLIPLGYGGDSYFNENKEPVGNLEALLNWYRAQPGVSSVEDTSGDIDNTEASFVVTGSGYIPTQLYYGEPLPQNRVFGTQNPVAPTIQCHVPQIGVIEIIPIACEVPVIGSIEIIPVEVETAAINDYGNWEVDQLESLVVLSPTYARLKLKTTNTTITESESSVFRYIEVIKSGTNGVFDVPAGMDAQVINWAAQSFIRTTQFTQSGTTVTMIDGTIFLDGDLLSVGVDVPAESGVYLTDEIVGVISQPGRPATPQSITIGDAILTIDLNGNIRWTGAPTFFDGTESAIEVEDIFYNLT